MPASRNWRRSSWSFATVSFVKPTSMPADAAWNCCARASRSFCFCSLVFITLLSPPLPRVDGLVQQNARTHGRGEIHLLDVLALRGRGLGLHDGVEQRLRVLAQAVVLERDLADADVDDARLIDAVLDLAGLRLAHGRGDVEGDGAGLRVGHQAAGAEHLTQLADEAHHVGRGDDGVEVEPAALDAVDDVLAAGHVGAGLFGLLDLLALRDDEHADGLADAVRQHDGAAHELVGLARVDAQPHRQLDRLVELARRHRGNFLDLRQPLVEAVLAPFLNLFEGGAVLLAVLSHSENPLRYERSCRGFSLSETMSRER